MVLLKDISLKPYNTFGVEARAKHFGIIQRMHDLSEVIPLKKSDDALLILGGGSNLLFVRDFDGLVLHNALQGIEVLEEDRETCLLKVFGGENWSALVDYTVEQGWGGIENLSLIPGTVGAAPIQNIGAYGVELCEVLEQVETIDLHTGKTRVFDNESCQFGYRTSIFKTSAKGQYLVTAVTLRLAKEPKPDLRYAALREAFAGRDPEGITPGGVSAAVKAIRRAKLPDPAIVGNAGSFFKNPVVKQSVAGSLRSEYPDIPIYPAGEGEVKIAAGWLIEKCGWKGRRSGNAGVHDKQALVLVNLGGASGEEIFSLSERIREDVRQHFGILLEREVTVI